MAASLGSDVAQASVTAEEVFFLPHQVAERSCGHSVHHCTIQLGSFVDSGSDVEDAVESSRRALYLGGYEGRSSGGCLDCSGAAAE
nr:hypothetical protein Itr_chr09CG00140 [Ipomoea trifida]